MTLIHSDDQATIEKLHTDVTNKINDQLLTFQDDSYALGLARGIKQSDALHRELVEALSMYSLTLTGDDKLDNAEFGSYAVAREKIRRAAIAKAVQP